jgi:hypothetical protein
LENLEKILEFYRKDPWEYPKRSLGFLQKILGFLILGKKRKDPWGFLKRSLGIFQKILGDFARQNSGGVNDDD